MGNNIKILIPEDVRAIHIMQESNYFHSPHPRPMGVGNELPAMCKDGREFPAGISLNPTQLEEKNAIFCAVRHITKRKKVEEELFKFRKLESIRVLAVPI